jgi:hypothetical protein
MKRSTLRIRPRSSIPCTEVELALSERAGYRRVRALEKDPAWTRQDNGEHPTPVLWD